MNCFSWILVLLGMVFILITMIRWFEQIGEAVRNRWWNKTALLVLFPFAVWFFPGAVAAGRPIPAPLHEPVRGFGSLPKNRPGPSSAAPHTAAGEIAPSPATSSPATSPDDVPPPGTPVEFIGKPVVPPKKARSAGSGVDPEKLAKLRQKMREQGMLDEE